MSLPIASQLFFPNVAFRMLRSSSPPHVAVFKVPRQLNKIDIRNYLTALYDVRVSAVRTAVFLGRRERKPIRGQMVHVRSAAYKKAIVTMLDDFHFPPPDFTDSVPLPSGENRSFGKGSHTSFKEKIKARKAAARQDAAAQDSSNATKGSQ